MYRHARTPPSPPSILATVTILLRLGAANKEVLTQSLHSMIPMADHLSPDPNFASERRSARRNLPLLVEGRLSDGERLAVQIYNISETGLLMECDADPKAGDRIEVDLPHAGLVSAKIVWTSGLLFGCQFRKPLSAAALSAVQLRSAATPHLDALPEERRTIAHFGARLQRLRVRKGLSQADIAAHLGVSAPSISGWEKGRARPKNARLDALAELLGVSLDELIDEPEPESIQTVIDRSREEIARAVGTSPEKVKISVEL